MVRRWGLTCRRVAATPFHRQDASIGSARAGGIVRRASRSAAVGSGARPRRPDEAEGGLGVRGTSAHTQPIDQRLNGDGTSGDTGTRTRGREFAVHPDEIKQLRTGWALVASPGRTQPRITRMLHPEDAR